MKAKRVHCNSCNVLVINNHICHEPGCPERYKDEIRECKWCGGMFTPEHSRQECCSDDCHAAYYGIALENMEGEQV